MKKGTRVRHRTRGFTATVDGLPHMPPPKPQLIALFRDDDPSRRRFFIAADLEVITEPSEIRQIGNFMYYEIRSVVKVDMSTTGWETSSDELFGLAQMVTHPDNDGILHREDVGAHMVDAKFIDEKVFAKLKYKIFSEDGKVN